MVAKRKIRKSYGEIRYIVISIPKWTRGVSTLEKIKGRVLKELETKILMKYTVMQISE